MSSIASPTVFEPGLGGRLLQVADGDVVLAARVGARPGEVDVVAGQPSLQLTPALDELLVQGVPLVVVGVDVLPPVPLQQRRLEQRGRGVGVVLQHLRRAGAVVAQVEAAVDVRVAAPPRRRHALPRVLRDREVAEALGGDDVVHRLQAHRVQHLDVGLEREHLVHRERVVHRLVPVRARRAALAAAGRAVDHALLADDLLPPGARGAAVALHVRSRSRIRRRTRPARRARRRCSSSTRAGRCPGPRRW